MHYTIEQIATFIGARIIGARRTADYIDWLLTDSRSLVFPETTLFFALRTRTGDGHRYLSDLYRRGVRHFVVETDCLAIDKVSNVSTLSEQLPEATFLVVDAPLRALQCLAKHHRETYHIPVIGVTGSNGKTVVKEWLYRILMSRMVVTRSPRSYNSQVGVPLSVCLLSERSQLGIFEAGISEPGEMKALHDIIQPTVGIFTNLGQAHQRSFDTLDAKCREKLRLFTDAEALVYNADADFPRRCLDEIGFRGERIGWSRKDSSAPLYVKSAEQDTTGTRFSYVYSGEEYTLEIPFTDEASTENAMHCLALSLYLGCTPEHVARRMACLEPVAMRLEVSRGVRGLTVINDSYNSDVNSLDIALDFAERRAAASTSSGGETASCGFTLILSDIEQSELPDEELYRHVAAMVKRRSVKRLIGVGKALCREKGLFCMPSEFYATTAEFLRKGVQNTLHSGVVLLKGARSAGFEAIADTLARRVHDTTLAVNLEALAANLNHYRAFLKPETRMVCMIKADAYGMGAVEVAKTLQDRGVDYLAVAVADEGAQLRNAGIKADIIVMNPELSSFHTLFEHHLQPEVYSFELLEALIRAARHEGITDFPIHIKLDTGMGRLGFDPRQDIPALTERLLHQAALVPRSVFSHFAGADSAEFDAYSEEQFRLFDEASKQLQRAFPHAILRHICNSAGIERFPERHLDMVRLGLGLYGINPITGAVIHNVASLRTTVLQVRDVPVGGTVGYSRRGKFAKPGRVAAIPIGYADGLNRHLGNGCGYCLINGQSARYVGNICMDVCLVDVTDIPCRTGDEVEIFGDALPVTILSDALDTIPYEVLTAISPRVRRMYFQ